MSIDVMVSMLRKGSTGAEILNILNAITGDTSEPTTESISVEPTLDEIEF
jgi:hypothetical protein